jgi:hypothetical protein
MGRGTISGGGPDGRYTLQLDYGTGIRDARITIGDIKIERLNIEIAEASDAILLAEARTMEAAEVLKTVLDAIVSAQLAGDNDLVTSLKPSVDKATSQYARVLAEEAAYRVPRDLKIAERKELVATKGRLQAAKIEETKQAWCVDLTEDASGEVATIEIPGEDKTILIAPGGRAPTESDGRLVAREVMSPEQAFWNAAVLPGWQKFKPTYRKATITFLDRDTDTATVNLDAATSSAAGLNVNQSTTLAGIPVDYMECNAVAFEVGDRVVVGFDGMNWGSPKVIGFVESPKPCAWICRGGNLISTGLYLECMENGLVDQIMLGGASVAGWFNGAGPTAMPPESPFLGLYRQLTTGINERVEFLISAAFVPPFFAHATLGDQPLGGVTLFALPPRPWAPSDPTPSTLEVVLRIGGAKKMHIAITSIDANAAQIKGAPISPTLLGSIGVTRLPDYTFVGS